MNYLWTILLVAWAAMSTVPKAQEVAPVPAGGPLQAGEYFIDADPGFGAGIPIEIGAASDEFRTELTADTSSLAPGPHSFFVRFQDESGKWGETVGLPFLVLPHAVHSRPDLAAGEVFVGDDPGSGAGTPIPGVGGSVSRHSIEIDTTELPPGAYSAFVRYQDTLGHWSLPGHIPFIIPRRFEVTGVDWRIRENEGPVASGLESITAAGPALEHTWMTSPLNPDNPGVAHVIEARLIVNETVTWLTARHSFDFAVPPPHLFIQFFGGGGGGNGGTGSIEIRLQEPMVEGIQVEESIDLISWSPVGQINPGETVFQIDIGAGNRFFRARQ